MSGANTENITVNEIPEINSFKESMSVPEKSNEKKNMPKAVRVILCILLSVMLAALLVYLSAAYIVRTCTTERCIERFVDNTDYMTIPMEIDGVRSNLYEMFFMAFANADTPKVNVYSLARQAGLDALLADKILSYTEFILYGKPLDEITAETVQNFYQHNAMLIDRTFNAELDGNRIDAVIAEQSEVFAMLSRESVEAKVPVLGFIRIAMSSVTAVIGIILAAAALVGIGVLSRSTGTPLVIGGAVITAIGAVLAACPYILLSFGLEETAAILFDGILAALLRQLICSSVLMITVGVVAVLAGAFFGQIRRNIRKYRA